MTTPPDVLNAAAALAKGALKDGDGRYRALFDAIDEAFCVVEMIYDGEGRPDDYRFLDVNAAFERQTGLSAPIGKRARELVPALEQRWFDMYGHIVETGEPQRFEDYAGVMGIWYSVFAFRLGSAADRRLAILFHDITPRRAAEAALRRSEERFRAFVTASSDVVYQMSPDWSEMRRLKGRDFLRNTDQPDASWLDVYIHPDDQTLVRAAINESIAAKSMFELEHRVIRGDGSLGWTHSRAVPILGDDGEINEWLGSASDVTERVEMEEALRAREADLARVQRIGEVGGLNIDVANGLSATRSPEYLRLHGLSQGTRDETHADWLARVHPDDRAGADEALFAALNGTAPSYDSQYRIVRPSDGQVRWIHARADIERDAAGRAARLVGAHVDVTEQKRLAEVLRDSEAQIRGVLDSITEGFALIGPDFTILDVNKETLRLDGRKRDELVGHSHWQAFPGSEQAPIGELLKRVSRERVPGALEHEYRWPDSPRSRWIDTRAYPAPGGDIAVFWRDITDRKAAEAALHESEERQRLMIELVPALLWAASADGQEISLNEGWLTYTGQSAAAADNFGWLDAIHPDDLPGTRNAFAHAFSTGEPVERQQRIRRADGSYRWHIVRHVPVRDAGGGIGRWFGAAIDVDDMRQLQGRQQLLLAELQHRVRNILTVVRSVFGRTIDAEGSIEEIADHFRGRLDSLARTQVVATQTASGRADLQNLIRDELLSVGAADGPHLTIEGPDVLLSSKAAEVIGLAIHELTTNALKYGALKVKGARLRIEWHVNILYRARRLNLTWIETGVPAIAAKPSRRGFGTELIVEALPYQLSAETSLEFKGGGVVCSISVPLETEEGSEVA